MWSALEGHGTLPRGSGPRNSQLSTSATRLSTSAGPEISIATLAALKASRRASRQATQSSLGRPSLRGSLQRPASARSVASTVASGRGGTPRGAPALATTAELPELEGQLTHEELLRFTHLDTGTVYRFLINDADNCRGPALALFVAILQLGVYGLLIIMINRWTDKNDACWKLLLPSECRAGMALRVPEADDFGSGLPLDAPLTGGCGALELGNATSIEDCEAGACGYSYLFGDWSVSYQLLRFADATEGQWLPNAATLGALRDALRNGSRLSFSAECTWRTALRPSVSLHTSAPVSSAQRAELELLTEPSATPRNISIEMRSFFPKFVRLPSIDLSLIHI